MFNKIGESVKQISDLLYVDDLMMTSESQDDLDTFGLYLKREYPVTRITSGTILDFVGMTFNVTTAGEVRVTIDK